MDKPSAIVSHLTPWKPIPAAAARELHAKLTAWFLVNKRSLQFRETTDPYKIMVSEFMLQQTTVAAVEPYFARFIDRYPTVELLAVATEDEVMSLWAGLGYYRRARQLHASAKQLVEVHNGCFPTTVGELQKLPGFGRYTAGAVVSLAFDLPGAIVEANTVRVFARIAGIQGTIGEVQFMKSLWNVSENLLSTAPSPRMFNTAAMELGSLVCRPQPLCISCPLTQQCQARLSGLEEKLVQVRPRRENIYVESVCLALRNQNGHYAVRRIGRGEWHSGMWEFPMHHCESDGSSLDTAKLFLRSIGYAPEIVRPFTTLRYQVTHHKVTLQVFHSNVEEFPQRTLNADDIQFLTLKHISALPMGSAQKKLLLLLTEFNTLEIS